MPHYDRNPGPAAEQNESLSGSTGNADAAAMNDAAAAIREAEVDAVQDHPEGISSVDAGKLDSMTIEALRKIAQQLDVPDRGKITEQDELIAAIRRRL